MQAGFAPDSLLLRKPARLARFVAFSVAAHAGVVAAAVVVGMFNRPPPLSLDQEPIKASLVRLGKERDKKLLPRKEELPAPPKEVQAPEPAPVPVPEKPVETVPVPGIKPEPAPKVAKQSGAKTGEQKKASLFDAFSKASAEAPDELEGAADGDPYGDSAVQEGDRYLGSIKANVRRYYDVSNTIGEQERTFLKAVAMFRIARNGALLGDPRIVKSSGNELFDSAVVGAIKRAAPFAPPPDHLRRELEAKGFIAEFRP